MNVQCTHCNTVFRVDPRKVPASGLRARCSICRGVFEVAAPAGPSGEAAEPVAAAVSAPEGPASTAAPAAPVAPASPPMAAAPAPPPPPAPAPTPAPAPAAAAPAPRPAAPAPAAPAAAARTASPFGSADPGAKARRLARALVSDIVTYHPERRDRALSDGTLKREFMDEIKKSWEEYVEQVGTEMARSTPHFRDALNDLLAKGQQVF